MPAAAKAPVKKPAAPAGTKKPKAPIPTSLRTLMVHKSTRPLWLKIKARARKAKVDPATLIKKKPKVTLKKIGGEKNGGERKVLLKKPSKYYPTEDVPKKKRIGHVCYKQHKRTFKSGIEPGRVLILLAGRHKGKRVVVLKTLPSGLILVTGPHCINGVPLRRMHQMYTIVTSTKLDLSNVKLPEGLNDTYFSKQVKAAKKAKNAKKGDSGDIFDSKVEAYKPDELRKKDQIAVDKQIVALIRKNPDKNILLKYLGAYFQLRKGVYPHELKF